MPKSKPMPRNTTSRGGQLVRTFKTSRAARRAAGRAGSKPEPVLADRGAQASIDRWHEFHGGPWGGERIEIGASPDGYEHLIPHRPAPGVGEWIPNDAFPNAGRYVWTGSYGETVVMTWWPAPAPARDVKCLDATLEDRPPTR